MPYNVAGLDSLGFTSTINVFVIVSLKECALLFACQLPPYIEFLDEMLQDLEANRKQSLPSMRHSQLLVPLFNLFPNIGRQHFNDAFLVGQCLSLLSLHLPLSVFGYDAFGQ